MNAEQLRVGMSWFTDYLVATPGRRLDVVAAKRRSLAGSYAPGPAYYDAWERAVVRGRVSGDDAAVLTEVAERQTQASRQAAYRQLSEGWLGWLGSRSRTAVRVRRAVWSAPGVDVSVQPQLGLVAPNGAVDVVWMYLRSDPLTVEASRGALRLLELHMDEICPGGTPVVLDVRRSEAFKAPARWRKNFDGWLMAEAAALATMWTYREAS